MLLGSIWSNYLRLQAVWIDAKMQWSVAYGNHWWHHDSNCLHSLQSAKKICMISNTYFCILFTDIHIISKSSTNMLHNYINSFCMKSFQSNHILLIEIMSWALHQMYRTVPNCFLAVKEIMRSPTNNIWPSLIVPSTIDPDTMTLDSRTRSHCNTLLLVYHANRTAWLWHQDLLEFILIIFQSIVRIRSWFHICFKVASGISAAVSVDWLSLVKLWRAASCVNDTKMQWRVSSGN